MKQRKSIRSRQKRILVVDDHPMMRFGLRQFLGQEPDMVVCGEAGNAADALSAIERTDPDLVLVDVSLEGRSGLDLLHDMRIRFRDLPVLVHSMHDESIYAERALRAGARGYLMKQESGGKLAQAVRQVLRGDTYLSDRLRASRQSQPGKTAAAGRVRTPIGRLTPREFEVFQLIGRGRINREIARHLHISLKTVEAHREHMKRKLHVNTSTALNLLAVRWASEQGA